jgi:hypothetical protein
MIQGFYTDRDRYYFISINNEGLIKESSIYSIFNPQDGKIIFNFIVIILESAMKSFPNVSSTKDTEK